MTSVLDESIGDFVSMLRERNMWDNTLLWVTTDNGGMVQWQDNFPASASSNYLLRAGKASLFEGGVRGISFVTGGFLPASASVTEVHGLLQHVDIPATFAALAGTSFPLADGHNMWNVIADGQPSPRHEVPVNIDTGSCKIGNVPANTSFSALISGTWKIISGARGLYDGWWSNGDYTREDVSPTSENATIDGRAVWLFDLGQDPNERENLALTYPEVVGDMQRRLDELSDPSTGYVAPQDNSVNPRALPALHGGVWAPFQKAPVTV